MARSLKKGPYVEKSLMKKVQEMNKSNKRQLLRLGQEDLLFFLILLVIL